MLVTTAAHTPRSVGVFNRLDWPVIPYPVDHFTRPDKKIELSLNFSGNLENMVMAATEWAGLAAYLYHRQNQQSVSIRYIRQIKRGIEAKSHFHEISLRSPNYQTGSKGKASCCQP